jgi:hypothetical protein
MLKKIIGAAIGAKIAKNSPAVGGATGVALATAVPFIISRASLPSLVMLGAASYMLKRHYDQNDNAGAKGTHRAASGQASKVAV